MVWRQLRVNRNVLIVLAALVTINDIVQVTSYESVFPDPNTRASALAEFTGNGALRALYGFPYDITEPTGWLAWRSMGFMGIVMAMWAAFITVGALRGEEEAGRGELALSQPQPRRVWFAAALAAVTIEALVVGAVNVAGLSVFCVTKGLMTFAGTVGISLQLVLPALLFAGVAAVASQLIGTARGARIATAAVLAVAFFVRTAADAGSGMEWLRWLTPLGWFEELHPPASPSVVALAAIAATAVVLVLASMPMLAVRDVGLGLLPHSDSRKPRRFLLGAPWQAALRDDLPQLSMWVIGATLIMGLEGSLTKTVLDLIRTNSQFGRIFGDSFGLNAYIAAIFSLVQVAITLLVVTMVVGARGEEASGRLELLLAGPLSRTRWLLSRAALAAAAALALALLSAIATWAGARVVGQDVALGGLVEAAFNSIPIIIVSAGATIAALALVPRAVAFAYAAVAVLYLWDALGTAIRAPAWSLDVSPFHAVAQVPFEDFAVLPAAILTAVGVALAAVAAMAFRGRDLVTG